VIWNVFWRNQVTRSFCTLLILSVCTAANAGLTIQFTPSTNPVQPGNTTNISIIAQSIAADVSLYIAIDGPAGASLVNPMNAVNPIAGIFDRSAPPHIPEMDYQFLFMADLNKLRIPIPNMPNGTVVSGIQLLFQDIGTVEVYIFDKKWPSGAYYEYDRQTLMVIPEPMTLGLLALSGLMIRRRKG
jgi:hypothetical protein